MQVNFAETITITRYSEGDYADGVWTPGAYVDDVFVPAESGTESDQVEISGHIQLMNLKLQGDLNLMSFFGVQRPDGLIRILSNNEIKTSDSSTMTRADVIPWNGKSYELQTVSFHPKFPPTHWAGVALLIDEKTAYS